jgi:riboflavin biosynthesis pyrimidine reductase
VGRGATANTGAPNPLHPPPAPPANNPAPPPRGGGRREDGGMQRLWPEPAALDEDGLLDAYALERGDPHLRVNFVSSLDGAVEADGYSRGLSNPVDQRVLQLLRVHADAVLVGAGTLRHEGYGPMRLKPDLVEQRRKRGLPEQPTLVAVSAALNLDPSLRMFQDAPVRPVVLTHGASDPAKREALAAVADVVVTGESVVDLAVARAELARRGLAQVLCEGGPHLFGSLLAAGVVDELCLTMSSLLTGAGAGRIVAGPGISDPQPMRLVHLIESEGTLLTRYARV